MALVNIIVPILALVVTGYLFKELRILPESVGIALIQFAYYVAIPALLFVVIAQEKIATLLNWPFIITFGGVVSAVFLVILVGAVFWRKMALGAAATLATISTGSNAAIVGLPLLHSLFGHKIVAFAAITNVVVLNLLFLVQVFMLESGQANGADDKKSTLQHLKNTLLNPIILSVILATAFAITPFSLPKIVVTYMELLGAALTPCALFAVGMSIKLDDLKKSGAAMVFATCVKLLILPILVLVAARMIGVDALLTTVAVIIAAVPTATREFILARQYHVSEELVAGVISMTTALSVVTLIVWLLLLAHLYPGTFSFH